MTTQTADRIPVIVGVGEILDKPDDPTQGKEPLVLMAEALRRADADAGGGFLSRLDSLDIINELSWPYPDAPAQLSALLGVSPARAVYGIVGGQTPIEYLHEAALRIMRGESVVGAVCGAEAEHSVQRAAKKKLDLPWSARDLDYQPIRGASFQQPVARQLNVASPITVYPFYENAIQKLWGQTQAQARTESAGLWSSMSAVAAGRENAWLKRALTPAEIAAPGPDNRPIAFPYTKLNVANPQVNLGAATLVTSLAQARAAGIPGDRLVYLWAGAAAGEPRDYLIRDVYHRSVAMETVLETVMAETGLSGDDFDHVELYSCFPCVPKMARRVLGLDAGKVPTVTGGLTFFGAPLNNYMGHATVAMVETLRGTGKAVGLLYGQGGFVTKHHALVVSNTPRETGELTVDYSVQEKADARRKPVPPLLTAFDGDAAVETFTVLFDREGEATHGVVIARTAGDERLMARVPAADAESLAFLRADASPVGTAGRVKAAADGILEWRYGR